MIVAVDGCPLLEGYFSKHLHSNNSIDEENEYDEEGDPGQGLEGLDEGPEQGPDPLALRQQLDQPHHTEQAEEADRDHVITRLKQRTVIEMLENIGYLNLHSTGPFQYRSRSQGLSQSQMHSKDLQNNSTNERERLLEFISHIYLKP